MRFELGTVSQTAPFLRRFDRIFDLLILELFVLFGTLFRIGQAVQVF